MLEAHYLPGPGHDDGVIGLVGEEVGRGGLARLGGRRHGGSHMMVAVVLGCSWRGAGQGQKAGKAEGLDHAVPALPSRTAKT